MGSRPRTALWLPEKNPETDRFFLGFCIELSFFFFPDGFSRCFNDSVDSMILYSFKVSFQCFKKFQCKNRNDLQKETVKKVSFQCFKVSKSSNDIFFWYSFGSSPCLASQDLVEMAEALEVPSLDSVSVALFQWLKMVDTTIVFMGFISWFINQLTYLGVPILRISRIFFGMHHLIPSVLVNLSLRRNS